MVKISKKQIVSRLGLFAGAALAGVILTGCAEEVNQWWGGGQPKVEVTASVQTADPQAVTRAADGLNIASTGFSDNTKSVYIRVNKGTAGASDWTGYEFGISGTGASQTLTAPSPGPAFPSGVNSVQVYGWYPYNNGNKTFTVSAAQNTNANYNASDLMLANSAACTHNGTTVTPASLTFRHALTKMKVCVIPLSGVTINSIKLMSMKKKVTIDDSNKAALTVGAASSDAGDIGDITLFSGPSTSSAVTQCAVFPAQSKSGDLLVVNATAGGSTHNITYSLPASKTFTADREYVMNISLKSADVQQQTVSLEGWTTEGTINIGEAALAFDRSTLAITYGSGGNQTLQITGSITIASDGTTSFNVTSSNTSVATVSTTGTTVTITPVSVGSTTITVTDANNLTNTATCAVTVNMDIRKNPLWWMAQYNLGEDWDFVSRHVSAYDEEEYPFVFGFADLMDVGEIMEDYHLPTREEHASVIPIESGSEGSSSPDLSSLDFTTLSNPVEIEEEYCEVGGYTPLLPGTMVPSPANISIIARVDGYEYYAIRFINSPYCSAWHYKMYSEGEEGSPCAGMLIESYLLSGVTTVDQAKAKMAESGFATTTFIGEYDEGGVANLTPDDETATDKCFVQRFLPACGAYTGAESTSLPPADNNYPDIGLYWSASDGGLDADASGLEFSIYGSLMEDVIGKYSFAVSVRLFRNY